ncbi:hypothetical protein [Synechococcus sp. UW179A]|uniref:hypothetical protein n=1 Tax=Synechococcus sp. UW179A TaxID=2575510 RepID=UPI0014830668|nr:hypothetical protein [Synechococcus sp. UW179A]
MRYWHAAKVPATAVAAEITEAVVVGEHQNNVWQVIVGLPGKVPNGAFHVQSERRLLFR